MGLNQISGQIIVNSKYARNVNKQLVIIWNRFWANWASRLQRGPTILLDTGMASAYTFLRYFETISKGSYGAFTS